MPQKPGFSFKPISLKTHFLKQKKRDEHFYVISHLLNNPLWVLKYVFQELLELPYITWTEKPESTTRWSFKPKIWPGKSEGFQDPQRSTSPWPTSTTTPHGFHRVCTSFFWFECNIFLYIKQNEILSSIVVSDCYLKWNILFLCYMVFLL